MLGSRLDADMSRPRPLNALFVCDRETQFWTVTVKEEPQIVTQGKSLVTAWARLRDALIAVREDGAEVPVRGRADFGQLRLPAQLDTKLREAVTLRLAVLEQEERLQSLSATLASQLVRRGFTRRAAGQLLGLSGQRIQQLVAEDDDPVIHMEHYGTETAG